VPYTSRIKREKAVELLAARRTISQLACQARANSPLTADEGHKLDGLRKALDMEQGYGVLKSAAKKACVKTLALRIFRCWTDDYVN
jgi:hypothetical protein